MAKPLSPIERMIDAACGHTPGSENVTREDAPRILLQLAAASKSWWRQRRPVGWTEAQHLAHPTINTTTPAETRLARAVSQWVQRGG